jgi:hypothetical protein
VNASFRRIDLNVELLEARSFDAILTTGSMHHIEKLDHCFASTASASTDGGYLWLNDYVGPARFQWSDTYMRLADELLSTVRTELRIRERVVRCDAEALRAMDPSEAIVPHQIEDALYSHFEVVATFDRGGTLLAHLWQQMPFVGEG